MVDYDFKCDLDDILAVVNPIDETIFDTKKYFYGDFISGARRGFYNLKTEDRVALVYHYIFCRYISKYRYVFSQRYSALKLFISDTLEQHTDEFINYFFRKNKTILPFTFKRYLYYKDNHYRHDFKFNTASIEPENIVKLVDFLKPKFLNTDVSSDDFFYLVYTFRVSLDAMLRNPFLNYFNDIIEGNQYSEKQKTTAFIYLSNGQRDSDMLKLSAIIKSTKDPNRQLLLNAMRDYYPKTYRVKQIPYSDSYISFVCDYLEYGHVSTKTAEHIFYHIAYTNKRLNELAINLLEHNKDHDITWQLIGFLGNFKVLEAIPLLEEFLEKDSLISIFTYYSLFKINPKLHYTHRSKVERQHQHSMAFLRLLLSDGFKSCEKIDIQKALFTGNKKTLALLKELRAKTTIEMVDFSEYFLDVIINLLKEKCTLLDLVKENPTT